jgi:hypothetical protein
MVVGELRSRLQNRGKPRFQRCGDAPMQSLTRAAQQRALIGVLNQRLLAPSTSPKSMPGLLLRHLAQGFCPIWPGSGRRSRVISPTVRIGARRPLSMHWNGRCRRRPRGPRSTAAHASANERGAAYDVGCANQDLGPLSAFLAAHIGG